MSLLFSLLPTVYKHCIWLDFKSNFYLFLAKKHPEIVTIGIGDGGNEIGMGKVFERVAANVQYGSEIACTVASDYLISAGVSNWGGYALAKAIFMCVSCPVHERYRRKGIGHSCQFAATDFVSTIDQVSFSFITSVLVHRRMNRILYCNTVYFK